MNKPLARYVAAKLIEDIRGGNIPAPELCDSVSHFPIIDYARSLIKREDWNAIKCILTDGQEAQRTLGLALLKNILSQPHVRRYLEAMWRLKELTFRDRIGVQFTLLNIDDLDNKLKKELRAFVFTNWDRWLTEAAVRWAQGRGRVLKYCSGRLSDPKTPQSKYWIYICGVAASSDHDGARKLINQHRNQDDPFLTAVINQVLSRL